MENFVNENKKPVFEKEDYRKQKRNEFCNIMEKDVRNINSETADSLELYVCSLIDKNANNLDQIIATRNFLMLEKESLVLKSKLIHSYICALENLIENNGI